MRGAGQYGLAWPDHRFAAALLEDTSAAQRDTEQQIVAVDMLGGVLPTAWRKGGRGQPQSGQAAQIGLEKERLVSKRLDVVLDDGAAVDIAIGVDPRVFRKVVRRKSKQLGTNLIHGVRGPFRVFGGIYFALALERLAAKDSRSGDAVGVEMDAAVLLSFTTLRRGRSVRRSLAAGTGETISRASSL